MNSHTLPPYLSIEPDELSDLLKENFIGSSVNIDYISKLFVKLCSAKKEIIEWDTMPLLTSDLYTSPSSEYFYEALKILEDAEYTVLRHEHNIEGVRPIYIRMCKPKSKMFMCEWITETLIQASQSINSPLPNEGVINTSKHTLPKEYYTPFESLKENNITKGPINLSVPQIYSLNLSTSILYFTNFSMSFIDHMIINRLIQLLNVAEEDFIAQITKITKVSKDTFNEKLQAKELEDILSYCNVLQRNYKLLSSLPIGIRHIKILELITILHHILPNIIIYHQRVVQEHNVISNYLDKITKEITEKKIYKKFQFDAYIEKVIKQYYNNNYEIQKNIEHCYQSLVVQPKDLPDIDSALMVDFHTHYIYARHIPHIILNEYPKIREKLITFLLQQTHGYLAGKLSFNKSAFYNSRKMNSSINQFLLNEFPAYYAISKYPDIIWQVVHSTKKDSSKTQQLIIFFNIKERTLLPWIQIFNIDMLTLYYQTIKSMNFLAKLTMALKKTNAKLFKHLQIEFKKPTKE